MFRFYSLLVLLIFSCSGVSLRDQDGRKNSDEWWEVVDTENRAAIQKVLQNSVLYLRTLDTDLNNVHSCYEYKVVPNLSVPVQTVQTGEFCYPSIIITAVRKAGTSALYSLLKKHPSTISTDEKENCPFIKDRTIVEYFSSLPSPTRAAHGKIYIDGCVDLSGNMQMRSILRQPKTFYIMVVRNFADWVWSAYNYWCSEKEGNCDVSNHWTDKVHHKRSSFEFHKIVESTMTMNASQVSTSVSTPVLNPLQFSSPCDKAKNMYRSYMNKLWSHVDVSNTLVIAGEDLENNPERVWSQVSSSSGMEFKDFLGYDLFMEEIRKFKKYRVNTQDNKGSNEVTDVNNNYAHGTYSISNYEQLKLKTREMLDNCWKNDCMYTSLATGHNYTACDANSYSQFQDMETKYLENLKMKTKRNDGGYLKRAINSCETKYEISQTKKLEGGNYKDVYSVWPSLQNSQILILAKDLRQVEFFIKVLEVLTGFSNLVTLHTAKEKCPEHESKIYLAITTDIDKNSIVIDNEKDTFVSLKTTSFGCPEDSNTLTFNKVVIFDDDIMLKLWDNFQIINTGAKVKTDVAKSNEFSHFNWTIWESYVHSSIQSKERFTENINESLLNFHNGAKLSSLAIKVFSDSAMRALSKEKNGKSDAPLFHILQFIGLLSEKQGSSSAMTSERVECAYMQASKQIKMSNEVIYQHLEYAYSSTKLVCDVSQAALKYKIALPSNPKTGTVLFSCENLEKNRIHEDRKCKVRYSSVKSYRPLNEASKHHPVVLLANDNIFTTSLRIVIENASGYYSGAMEKQQHLTNTFIAEDRCGIRMSLIQAFPNSVSFSKGTISLSRAGSKKCSKGMIKSFSNAILQINDPFVQIWRQFLESKHLTAEKIGHDNKLFDKNEWKKYVKEAADAIDLKTILQNIISRDSYETFNASMEPDKVLLVSLESILYDETDGEKMMHLSRIMSFMNYHDTTAEKLECAIANTRLGVSAMELDVMKSMYHSEIGLICYVKEKVQEILKVSPFEKRLFFHNVHCV